jgi:hypothetical protein
LDEARKYAGSHPGDLAGQRPRFEQAAWDARETPLLEAARAELKALEQRQLEAFSLELSALEEKLRPALAAEHFSDAVSQLEEARRRRSDVSWTALIDRRLAALRETEARLFAALKVLALAAQKEGRRADLQAIRERIRAWGLAERSADLEKSLTPPPPPPPALAEPKPAPVEPQGPPLGRSASLRPALPDAARLREAEQSVRSAFNTEQARSTKEKRRTWRPGCSRAPSAPAQRKRSSYAILRQARTLAVQAAMFARPSGRSTGWPRRSRSTGPRNDWTSSRRRP